jgi:hypothetical protein
MSAVMGVPRHVMEPLPGNGVWALTGAHGELPCQWRARDRAENDETFLQIIPYALIRNARGELWCYERLGGDARVRHRYSCGVGGHVDAEDANGGLLATAASALCRELSEELAWMVAPSAVRPLAWLYEGQSAIGRVHLGLIYALVWTEVDPPIPAPGEPLGALGFRPAAAIATDDRFELWSRLAAGWAKDPS